MAVRVAVDALGGDRGPEEIVAGALAAAGPDVEPVVFGRAGLDTDGLLLVEADEEIGMDESPVEAVRAKPGSSLVRAVRAVADGVNAAAPSCGGCRRPA